MPKRDIIVIGASSGGLDVLKTLVARLPARLPASVFVVRHLSPDHPSALPDLLGRLGDLPAVHPLDGEEIEAGRIYLAPPDRHMMLDGRHVRVTRGPKENRFQPSVDVLFRSAALYYGPRAVGVVLSGALDDGASGLYAIKQRGGVAVVQDPDDALYADMPRNALRAVEADYVLPVTKMGEILTRLVDETGSETKGTPMSNHPDASSTHTKRLEIEVRIARQEDVLEPDGLQIGDRTFYTCPECHGTLMQIKEGRRTRFRCHTGHAFSLNTLLSAVTENVKNALWNAVRIIEESELLMMHLNHHLQESNDEATAAMLLSKVEAARQRAKIVRQVALANEVVSQDKVADATH